MGILFITITIKTFFSPAFFNKDDVKRLFERRYARQEGKRDPSRSYLEALKFICGPYCRNVKYFFIYYVLTPDISRGSPAPYQIWLDARRG